MWRIIEADGSGIQQRFHTGNLLSKVLSCSGLDDEKIAELLSADSTLHTSRALCVQKACERIMEASRRREKVFIGGDYDADGICATAIMKKTLDILGITNGYYIPDRFREGYGLSAATVRMAHEKGYSLIITVDNGVRAHEALITARELGMDVIVTDHHKIEEKVEADILVHPDDMEDMFSCLCGAGVALEISRYLVGRRNELTALAAVASIGDVMPLWKETRRIVLAGIEIIKQRIPRPVWAMFKPGSSVTWQTIAFQIVPKLNSVGRMNNISNVNTLVRFLLSENEKDIASYAVQLEYVNEQRKQLSALETEKAFDLMNDDPFPVIYDETFHEGICGLAAGRIAAQCSRPVLVMAKSGSLIKGSGRSVAGFDMFSFFSDFTETEAFGGHEQAVGISVREENFAEFLAHVKRKAPGCVGEIAEPEQTAIAIRADEISFDEIMELEKVSPLPREVNDIFAITDAQVLAFRETAGTYRWSLACANGNIDAIAYKNRGIDIPDDPCVMIGTLSVNRWRSQITCRMEIEDIQ